MKILAVPWALSEPLRPRPFTELMEAASILCLVHSGRRRPKILKSRAETLSYLSKLHYPFWAIHHAEGSLIIDGLGLLSHTVRNLGIPDIKSFAEELSRASVDFNLYRKTINTYYEAFRDFEATFEANIPSLVGDLEILRAIGELLSGKSCSKFQQPEGTPTALLKIGETEAFETAKRFTNVYMDILSEIRALQYAIRVVKEEMELHREKILTEVSEIEQQYNMQLNELRPIVNARIEQLRTQMDSRMKKIMATQEKRLKAALKGQEKLGREMMRLESRIGSCLAKRRALRRKDTSYLEATIEISQKRMKEISERIKVISKIAETIRSEGDIRVRAIKDEYDGKIGKERNKIGVLEASRDAETSKLRKRIEELEGQTSSMRASLAQLTDKKKQAIAELEGIRVPVKVGEPTSICIPFYAAKYKAEEGENLRIFPLVLAAKHEGLGLRLRRAVKMSLESRIRLLLSPRSELLEKKVFGVFERSLREDAALREVIDRNAEQSNLLMLDSFKGMAVEGSRELVEEGWIEEKEREEILDEYAS